MRCLLVNTGLRVDLNDVARIRRSVEDVMSMLASHPSPNFGPDAPVPSGIDLGDGGSVQIPRGGGPGNEDPELSCICCLVPVEQDPEPTDPDGGGRGGEGRSLSCCSDGVCDDGEPCTVNDRCGGPLGLGCVEGSCCGEGLRCPRGKCDRRAYCAGGVCVQEPKVCEDDGKICTLDECDEETGACGIPLSDIPCGAKPNFCTKLECKNGNCEPKADNEGSVCNDDGNLCTIDRCRSMVCTKENINEGADCPDDGDVCTDDVCRTGACKHDATSGPHCEDDDNECTLDICMDGECAHLPYNEGAVCEQDEDPCIKHVCNDSGGCVPEPDNEGGVCEEEEDPCIKRVCASGSCTTEADNEGGTCADEEPPNECTDDVCRNGSCAHEAVPDGTGCEPDENPCTDDICQGGTCTHPSSQRRDSCSEDGTCCGLTCCANDCCDEVCCQPEESCCGSVPCCKAEKCCDGAVCCTDNQSCCNGLCETGACSFSVEPATGCAGTTVTLTLTDGTCEPDCDTMSVAMVKSLPFLSVNPPASIYCGDSPATRTFTATIAADAPAGEIVFGLEGTTDAASCSTLASVTVVRVDLDVDSDNDGDIDDDDEAIEDETFSAQQPGKWGWTNNDDSDGDMAPDNANIVIDGATDLEDIGSLVVRGMDTAGLTNPALWVDIANPALIRVFKEKTANGAGIAGGAGLPASVNLSAALGGIPTADWTLGMEGLMSGSTTVLLRLMEDGVELCRDTVLVTVIKLKVEWETLGVTPVVIAAANNHPSGTLGVKHFPGATTPGGAWDDLLGVRIITTPPVKDVPIYLEAFDPDDPSANNDVVDDDLDGGDNNDKGDLNANPPRKIGLDLTQSATPETNAVGKLLVTFRVAQQPGDNHRVAATMKQVALDVVDDNNVPPSSTDPATQDQVELFIGNISPLLTVWRKVHVELDSMGPPDATNTQTGVVQAPPVLDPNPNNNNATIDIEDLEPNADWEQVHQHLVGRIDIQGFGSFTTIDTIISTGDDQVVINNAPPTIVNANGAQYALWDDDAGSTPGFVMIGANYPPVALPVLPDTGFMSEAYAPAYIFPVPDVSGFDPQSPTPFDRQIVSTSKTDVRDTANFPPNLNLTSAPEFWAVHVTSGFQGPPAKDADPGTEAELVYGVTDSWENEPVVGGSITYLEVIRDFSSGNQPIMVHLEQFTVVHEVGHQFYLLHKDGAGGFIMTDQMGLTPFSPIEAFSPCSLLKIREQQFPQGPDPKITCPGQN